MEKTKTTLEIKTFSSVLDFDMWRCEIKQSLTENAEVWAEVTSLISCSSEVIAQI